MTTVEPAADAPPPSATPAAKAGLSTLAKVLIAIGAAVVVLVLLVTLLVLAVFAATAGPARAAHAFFATTAQSGPAVAYNLASPSFRSVVSDAQWAAYAKQYGLAGYTGASWSSRSVTNGVATLQGSLKLAGGGALPATVQLTSGGGGWQVLHLKLADGGVSSGSASDMAATSTSSASDMSASAQPPATGTDAPPSNSDVSSDPGAASPSTARPAREVPGAMLSGLCRQMLAQQAHARFDSIECPDALPARPGAATACMVRKGGQSALMTARLESFDATTGHFQVDCKVADHPLS